MNSSESFARLIVRSLRGSSLLVVRYLMRLACRLVVVVVRLHQLSLIL